MRWIPAVVVLIASSAFLYQQYRAMNAPAPAPTAPAAPVQPEEPLPFLTEAQLKAVRASTKDPDSAVRWSATELLYTLKDPASADILEKVIAGDADAEVRMKAVKLLESGGSSKQLPGLIKALDDADTDVRLASLKAIGAIADPAAAPRVAALLKDPDSDIRSEALRTLGKFQEKRMKDFQDLTDELRRQYEAAVKKARENAQ